MEIGAAGSILTQENTKTSMGQQYPYPTRWEKNILSIIHIYRPRAVLLLFYDCQDTEHESHEI